MNKNRRQYLKNAIDYLLKAKDIILKVKSEEEFTYDNIPENLQYSTKGCDIEENIDSMEEIIDNIDDIVSEINDIIF